MELNLKYPLSYKSRMGGVLAIHGDNGLTKNKKKLLYTCSLCSRDKELYPLMFASSKIHLDSGKTSCGCSKKPEWSPDQYLVRVARVAESVGILVKGYTGVFKGNLTEVNFVCSIHGGFSNTVANVLSNDISPCSDCARTHAGYSGRLSKDTVIGRFTASGQFPLGPTFTPTSTLNKWIYHCPICSVDEYHKAGLCDGRFVSHRTSLEKGYLPCRCSIYPRLTKEQAKFKLSNIVRSYQINNKRFSSVVDFSKYIKCLSNGDHLLDYNKLQQDMPREYRKNKLDNLYVLKMYDGIEVMIKVGRTFNLKERFIPYKRLYSIELLLCVTDNHETIKKLEKQLLNNLSHLRYHPSKFFKGHTECLNIEATDILTEEFIMKTSRGITDDGF